MTVAHKPTNCLSVIDRFVGLQLKVGLSRFKELVLFALMKAL